MSEVLHDADIREPLFDWLEARCRIVRFLEEKTMGRSRADIIMVREDMICGIEIKSDADTYARLSRQVKDYDRCCDRCYAAVGVSHAYHIEEHLPPYWGIITVEKIDAGFDFYMMREAMPNPRMNLKNKLSLLWRPELAAIQKKYGLPAYKEKSKKFVEEKLYEKLDHAVLNHAISDALFERDYTTIASDIETYRQNRKRKETRHVQQ